MEEPLPLENSAQTAQDPSASAPLAESGERTVGEVARKAETREEKALNAPKKAQAEGNKAEHEGNQAEWGRMGKMDTKVR